MNAIAHNVQSPLPKCPVIEFPTTSVPLQPFSIEPDRAKAIRLVVTDIDGTISGVNNDLNPVVKETIQAVRDKGIQVAIATGRMYCSARRYHQELNLTTPILAYQGAWIQNPLTDQLHRHWTLGKDHALQLLDYFEAVEFGHHLSIHAYVDDRLYVREMTPETELYIDRTTVTVYPVGDLRTILNQAEATKLLALSHNSEHIDSLYTDLRARYSPAELYLTKSVATFFEATNPLVNKGTAVQYLAEELMGLQPHEVMTIGDNFNDVEMLDYAGISVAMGNAPSAVQQSADWVAPDVESDGAAIALQKLFLD